MVIKIWSVKTEVLLHFYVTLNRIFQHHDPIFHFYIENVQIQSIFFICLKK